jgi:endoglucanase
VTGPPRAQRVGEIVGGKYRLLRYLAAGGMGAVYEAVHTVVGRRFAIKLLHPELAVERDSLARFQREAQAAGAIENENVAAALDFGIAEDGSPFIVMEYLAGESLRATIDSTGHVPLGRAADIVMQACRGVAAAHRAGIVHRDLNPQNLFLCHREDGTDLVKVLDFGIAKLEAPQSAETRTGTVLGTPAYLSPEQARGEKTVDHRTDIYGLGAILYELISGQKPHPGDSHNAILHHICTQPALPLDTKLLALPSPLVASVEKALSSDPSDRQDSAEALGQELAAFAKREVWPAPRGQGIEPSLAVVASTPAGKEGAASAKEGKGRRRAVVLAAVLTVAVVAALVAAIRATRTSPVFPVAKPLALDTRFFVPPPNPAAIQQIGAFVKSNAAREAAMITAMAAIPQAVWFAKGTPEEVQSAVGNPIVRAVHDRSLPVLVAYNRPYRDCAGFSAGGAKDSATYQAWIEGLARGIGNEHALLILEPDGLGILPYNTSLDGTSDWCKPTVTDARGNTVPAPGATADEIYAESNRAVATFHKLAPNALVYLDGAHAGWLPVGEAAYRLYRGGVLETQGFAVNVSNYRLTWQSIRYGTWISRCIDYATRLAQDAGKPEAFRRCVSQPMDDKANDKSAWEVTDKWYADNAPGGVASSSPALPHFVIDTGRNGQGPLDVARYAEAPYHQPAEVIRGLVAGAWCNPPGMGLGLRPTADTGVPLLDAYLWIKTAGESDGSCDIAGNARAWDFAKYNPWGISGEGQMRFDPLWGMVLPAAGMWFPEQALELAQKAVPPLVP